MGELALWMKVDYTDFCRKKTGRGNRLQVIVPPVLNEAHSINLIDLGIFKIVIFVLMLDEKHS
ncbi:MAG: hypothetical protein Q4D90_08935 [bacterium]|nr:hypothetical protein [bacterium]